MANTNRSLKNIACSCLERKNGWKNPSVTIQIYMHVIPSSLVWLNEKIFKKNSSSHIWKVGVPNSSSPGKQLNCKEVKIYLLINLTNEFTFLNEKYNHFFIQKLYIKHELILKVTKCSINIQLKQKSIRIILDGRGYPVPSLVSLVWSTHNSQACGSVSLLYYAIALLHTSIMINAAAFYIDHVSDRWL